MGKHQAASVSWTEISAAIRANPKRSVGLQMGTASATVSTLPDETAVAWISGGGWTEDASFTVTDPVSFSLWVRDPLYRIATPAIRRSLEMEEAAFLLHGSEAAWKQHNGRTRSWIRKHLEEDLRLRAGGGDPAPDAWEAIRTTKRAALLLDYVCVVRSLRVALWWPDLKAVTVVPLSGLGTSRPPVTQLNCLSGRMLIGPAGEMSVPAAAWPSLLLKASSEIVWAPPASAPSIGSNTVAQIHDQIQLLLGAGQPHVRTGGRTAIWNRLMWLTLEASLNGKDVQELADP